MRFLRSGEKEHGRCQERDKGRSSLDGGERVVD